VCEAALFCRAGPRCERVIHIVQTRLPSLYWCVDIHTIRFISHLPSSSPRTPASLRRRLIDGTEALARMLHGDGVSACCPPRSAMKLSLRPGQRCRQRLLPNYFMPYV
jgi:hypothetical protein